MTTSLIIILLLITCFVTAFISWLITRLIWKNKIEALKFSNDLEIKNNYHQKEFFEKSISSMSDAFDSLASKALNQNNENFVALAESKLNEKVAEAEGILGIKEKAVEGLVKPLSESLQKIDVKINELENKRENAYSNIHTVLEGMQRTTEALGKGTQNLVGALKHSATRGKYGEIGLRRVVEYAGMIEHCDFIEQHSINVDEGILRPDMIIRLPEKKTIVVDSKTPLEAYLQIFETTNEVEQKNLLAQHAKAVRDHLNKLAAKAYWSQFSESPDYVIFYMQIESSFGVVLQSDPSLIEEAIRKNIIFATPTTLITLLRTVAFVWQQRSIADNIEEMRDAGVELFDRTTVLLRHFSNMGGSLKTVVNHYNNTISSMESRFIPQAKKLHALGSGYTKNIVPEMEQIEIAVRQIDNNAEKETTSTE